MTTIDKYNDVIDSRDVIARIEELESERDGLQEAVDEAQFTLDAEPTEYDGDDLEGFTQNLHEQLGIAQNDLSEWDGAEEFDTLQKLASEGADYISDWKCGVTLIRDSYFESYAQELAEETGAIPDNAQWPCTCIDWEQATRELQMDYSAVEFDNITYWVR